MVKGKKFRKLTALATTAAMSVMMMSSFASAATTYTPVSGTSCDFNKELNHERRGGSLLFSLWLTLVFCLVIRLLIRLLFVVRIINISHRIPLL